MHIPEYAQGTWTNHAARRKRKLLLNRAEIDQDRAQDQREGLHARPAVALLQGRPRQGRDRPGQGQEGVRQAARARRARRPSGRSSRRSSAGSRATRTDGAHDPGRRRGRPGVDSRPSGLPGLVDVHTHFLPPRVMAKVRAQFDAAGPLIGRPWPLHYRDTDEALVEVLRGLGVRRFTALAYAHRPGMAEFLNDWSADFADRVPEAARCATFYPEPTAPRRTSRTGSPAESEVWKLHVQVGGFDVRDPLLDEAWGVLADAGDAGGGPRRQRPGRRPSSPVPAPVAELLDAAPAAAAGGRPRRGPGVRRVPGAGRAPRAGGARHHDGVHRLLRRDGRGVPARRCCPGCATSAWPARSCSAATSRTSRTPTSTSSRRLQRLDLGDDWLRAVLLGQRRLPASRPWIAHR